ASTCLFTKEAWERAGKFDSTLRRADDWWFALRVEHHIGWTYFPWVSGTANELPGGLSDIRDSATRDAYRRDRERVQRGADRLAKARNLRPGPKIRVTKWHRGWSR